MDLRGLTRTQPLHAHLHGVILAQRIDQDQHWLLRCVGVRVGVGHARRVLEGGGQCDEHGVLFDHVMFKTVDQSP